MPEWSGIYQIFQIAFANWKNFQFNAGSKSHFSPPVPERGVIDPQEMRRLGFVPPGRAKGFPE